MGHKSDGGAVLCGITQNILHPAKKSHSFKHALWQAITAGFLILFYYTFSIGLTFYNKWMFKTYHFPLMTTSFHFLSVFIYCAMSRAIWWKWRSVTPTLNWKMYCKNIFITGFASALDIGLSNWSFVFITVSLYTMVKSTAIIFILGFAIVLKLETPKWSLIVVVCLISSGLFMFVYESTQFNLEGFILVLSASFIGGIRWTFSQILTQKKDLGLANPIDLTYHLQPTMFVGLFPLALAHEGLTFFTSNFLFASANINELMSAIYMMVGGGVLAFFLSFSEYLLLSSTSSLTLSICGIFKEIATLVLASAYNGDTLTMMNWAGFVMCVMGITCHIVLKYKHIEEVKDDKDNDIQLKLLDSIHSQSDSENESEIFSSYSR